MSDLLEKAIVARCIRESCGLCFAVFLRRQAAEETKEKTLELEQEELEVEEMEEVEEIRFIASCSKD